MKTENTQDDQCRPASGGKTSGIFSNQMEEFREKQCGNVVNRTAYKLHNPRGQPLNGSHIILFEKISLHPGINTTRNKQHQKKPDHAFKIAGATRQHPHTFFNVIPYPEKSKSAPEFSRLKGTASVMGQSSVVAGI